MMTVTETSTAHACQLRAAGLRDIIEALSLALDDWQDLQERALAEGLDVTGPARDIAESLDRAARLISLPS